MTQIGGGASAGKMADTMGTVQSLNAPASVGVAFNEADAYVKLDAGQSISRTKGPLRSVTAGRNFRFQTITWQAVS